MIELTVPPAPQPEWWETALATVPGQLLVAGLAFGGVLLTLRHARKLQDRKDANDERSKRIDTERGAIAKLIVSLQPWISGLASWGSAYERAGGNAHSPNVQEMHDHYSAAAMEFSEALMIARVTVRNPAARPALDTLQHQRGIMTSLVSIAMLGKPDKDFPKYFDANHKAAAKALMELEEAALNWDGELTAPTMVRPAPLDPSPGDTDESTGPDTDDSKDGGVR